MSSNRTAEAVGLLLSGGLDSCILLAHMLDLGYAVQPLFIRTGVVWEAEELTATRRFLNATGSERLRELVLLELPLDDLYGAHWSICGNGAPSAATHDAAVYLPGRNPLLLVKAAVWCQMHGIAQVAIAPLASNPFADATAEFFETFGRAMSLAGPPIQVLRPFSKLTKRDVMHLGRGLPLEHTFSCIAPVDSMHCGECNKCGERKSAFELVGRQDPTCYATDFHSAANERVYL